MKANLSAESSVSIDATAAKVWDALTTPALIKKYLMGADVHTDWKVGSPLTYTGEYQGKRYEEKGVIQQIEPRRLLQATHFSTSSGKEDKPENYALVTWKLDERDGVTKVSVSQDNIADAKGVESSQRNWGAVLKGLKDTVEG